MDRLDTFYIGEAGSLAPVQELADCLVIRDPGILVPDRGTVKNSKNRLAASGPTSAMIAGIRKFSADRIDSE